MRKFRLGCQHFRKVIFKHVAIEITALGIGQFIVSQRSENDARADAVNSDVTFTPLNGFRHHPQGIPAFR